MNVLVINCGSSSLKFQLINAESEEVLAKGLCERIGIDGRLTYQPEGGEKEKSDKPMPTHTEAIQYVIEALTNPETGVVKDLHEIGAVGHRMVHGGEKFASSVIITEEVKKAVAECNELAPLHNPANLIGVDACEKLMPGTPMVAVFDTAFHQTMPEKAYMYGLPYEYYEKYKVRRYGFHGTSHSFVSKKAIFFASVLIIWRPSRSCSASPCVAPWIPFQYCPDATGIPVIVKYLFSSSNVEVSPPLRAAATQAPTFILLSK